MSANATYTASYLAQSKAPLLNTFYSIPIGLELISTTVRVWAKLRQRADAGFGYDDYLMIFATIVAVAECISGVVYGPPFGLGRHVQALSDYDLRMYMMGDYIFSHFYDVAIGCTKLSVLALYYRLFSVKTTFRLLIIATAAFVVAWIIVMEVVLGFACRPIQAFWGGAKGKCINLLVFTYFTNITNLVTDFWIFALPIPFLLRLQTSRDKRIGLCFLFSIGLGTCAISAARLSFVFGVGSLDFTWYETDFGILSAWEPCGGILCANLPIVYGAITHAVKKARGTLDIPGQGATNGISYQTRSERSLYYHWSRLGRRDSAPRESGDDGETTKEVSIGSIEMNTLVSNTSMEDR